MTPGSPIAATTARRVIRDALLTRAGYSRRQAASRSLTGPAFAATRAAWRAEAADCNELAGRLDSASPAELARALGITS